jgi:hypothetical protein
VGSAGVPVAYYGLFTIFATQKTMFYDSATEESVPPPKNQRQKPNNRATTPAQLPTNPSSPNSGKPQRGVALRYLNAPYFVWVEGHPLGHTTLMPYGAEMRDNMSQCATVNALDF